jgi:4-diphosphocytidyl-2-C-methyl-D-erythritol kinase
VIVFPNSKINLGLNILRKRSDGYHDLETVFYPIQLTDILEIIENKHPEESSRMPFTISGYSVPGVPASNICAKAYKLLKVDFPKMPFIKMHLHKTVPIGAGLGGGSADAAFALKLLNELFDLNLSTERLKEYAAELGSDCPFFILNRPCFATGRGEIMEEINLDLSNYQFVVVNPGIHINTGDTFIKLKPAVPEKRIMEIISQPIETWKIELQNDFEKVVFKQYREIVDIKDSLYTSGAVYASMSGSGSTVYGIFPKGKVSFPPFPSTYFVKVLDASQGN